MAPRWLQRAPEGLKRASTRPNRPSRRSPKSPRSSPVPRESPEMPPRGSVVASRTLPRGPQHGCAVAGFCNRGVAGFCVVQSRGCGVLSSFRSPPPAPAPVPAAWFPRLVPPSLLPPPRVLLRSYFGSGLRLKPETLRNVTVISPCESGPLRASL